MAVMIIGLLTIAIELVAVVAYILVADNLSPVA